MKLKLLAAMMIAGLSAGAQAMGNSDRIMMADDASSSAAQPLMSDNSSGTSSGPIDNAGSTQDSAAPSGTSDEVSGDNSSDTGTADDDY